MTADLGAQIEKRVGSDTLIRVTVVVGSASHDTMTGSGQGEGLVGLPGNNTLAALGGSDYLDGGPGGDKIDGGAGRDWLDYEDAPRRLPRREDRPLPLEVER